MKGSPRVGEGLGLRAEDDRPAMGQNAVQVNHVPDGVDFLILIAIFLNLIYNCL